jgi:hypothetical protein
VSGTDRRHELLADRALLGLPEAEARELMALGAADDDSFDLAAAAIALAELDRTGDGQDLPAALAARIEAAAPSSGARPPVERARAPRRPRWDRGRALAWTAAAAAALVAVIAWLRPPVVVERVRVVEVPPPQPSPAEARAALIAGARDATLLAWTATGDAAARGASGDVVWSNARQQGFLRIHGLAPNDPARAQYQLWIFDAGRDDAHPVDGGVFDVAGGDVVIPIRAPIRVFEPKLFAVTVERPGGVVVSKRERVVLTASL